MFTKKDNIFLNQKFNSKIELFEFIADKAEALNVIKSKKDLVDGFIKREEQGTTGLEDGFAIPHARVSTVLTPTVFLITNENTFTDYTALDGSGVKYAIALLIPEGQDETHMQILSGISIKLIDEDFRQAIKDSKIDIAFNVFDEVINQNATSELKVELPSNEQSKGLIVGISACPAGVAKTHMVKEKMIKTAKELGFDIVWETQGGGIQKDKLPDAAVEKADTVIISSDIAIDKSRFVGKKLLVTNTATALKDAKGLIEDALLTKIYEGEKWTLISMFKKIKNHFTLNFNGIWAFQSITMVLLGLFSLIGFAIFGEDWRVNPFEQNAFLAFMQTLSLMIIAMAMPFYAGNFVKTWTKNDGRRLMVFLALVLLSFPNLLAMLNIEQSFSPLWDWNGKFDISELRNGPNILATVSIVLLAILSGWIIDKIWKTAEKNKITKFITSNTRHLIGTTFVMLAVFGVGVYLLGAPLSYANSNYFIGHELFMIMEKHWWARFIMGGILVAMINYDLGGNINKLALVFIVSTMFYDLRIMPLMSVGIPISALGLGWFSKINKGKFRKAEDEADGLKSLWYGKNSMSEGPIALMNKYKLRVMSTNLITAFIAGGLVYVLGFILVQPGYISGAFFNAQAYLNIQNDIWFLKMLLPIGYWYTPLVAIAYGIVSYYVSYFIGILTYVGIGYLAFGFGKNKLVQLKGSKI